LLVLTVAAGAHREHRNTIAERSQVVLEPPLGHPAEGARHGLGLRVTQQHDHRFVVAVLDRATVEAQLVALARVRFAAPPRQHRS
jgi:hypothetical protein